MSPRIPVMLALLSMVASVPAECAGEPGSTVLVYRMRGEVRPFLFWLGRDDVGGGHITIRRSQSSPTTCREEVEVLFGSEPERVPGHINRWGYGLETADWVRSAPAGPPRLAGTEFQGIMRHSTESSMSDVVPEKHGADAAYLYDVTRSIVLPGLAKQEVRVFTDAEDFRYSSPDRLLAKYRDSLANTPPLRRRELLNAPGTYGEPYGFLSAVAGILDRIEEASAKSPHALRRARPSVVFVYNAAPYQLKVTGIRSPVQFQARDGVLRIPNVAAVEFECFNTVKRTRTDFSLWIPLEGELKGLPVRILFQPRWWLRLQLDLDRRASRLAAVEDCRHFGSQP